MCLPGVTELALTVLIGRTFVLLMGLPIQTKLALTGVLGGTVRMKLLWPSAIAQKKKRKKKNGSPCCYTQYQKQNCHNQEKSCSKCNKRKSF